MAKRVKLYIIVPVLLLSCVAMLYSAPKSGASSDASSPGYRFAPVIFIHGFLGSGDTWASQVQRFTSNGVPAGKLFAYDWNSMGRGGDGNAMLKSFVDSVLTLTGGTGVHLVGHSAGGGRAYSYLSSPERAATVISYVHIGSGAQRAPAGPDGSVPTLNIYSDADMVVRGGDIPGAQNVILEGADHYEVATSADAFAEMYRFFYGEPPSVTTITGSDRIRIGGRAVTLGTNQPATGVTVDLYVAGSDGNSDGEPVASFTIPESGNWGPVEVEPETNYMFHIRSERQGFRNLYYYFEPFVRDNPLVYLRTFPPPVSMAGMLLAGLPSDDETGVIAIFSSSQAVIHGRDNLFLNDFELSTPELAGENATSISFFCFDDGRDGQGDAEPVALFAAMPFLQGANIPVFTGQEQTWYANFNGRTIPVRNFRSRTEGVVIAVFW